MQKRLIEELQIIDINIKVIQESYFAIEFILNKLLSAPDKSFEVRFKGIDYNFIYPTTPEELQSMKILRRDLLRELFKEAFCQMVDGQNPWDMIRAFASGIDTLDMQVEIVGKEEMIAAKAEDGSNPSVPLDIENYQVKQELSHDIEVTQED